MKFKFFLFLSFFFSQIMFCGFSADTLIKIDNGYIPIGQLEVGDIVISSDLEGCCFEKSVSCKRLYKENDCLCIVINQEEIIASQNQKFFLSDQNIWKSAKNLEIGDTVTRSFSSDGEIQEIIKIEETELIEITVEDFHNFFISENELLVHNFAATMAVAAGTADAIAQLAFGVAAIAGSALAEKAAEETEAASEDSDKNEEKKENTERDSGAQAPGKPKEEVDDGYAPPKGWDKKKVRVQGGPMKGATGWPDNKGRAWVPTGPDGHGGSHWDRQNIKDGKDHENIYPGGTKRGEGGNKNK